MGLTRTHRLRNPPVVQFIIVRPYDLPCNVILYNVLPHAICVRSYDITPYRIYEVCGQAIIFPM